MSTPQTVKTKTFTVDNIHYTVIIKGECNAKLAAECIREIYEEEKINKL